MKSVKKVVALTEGEGRRKSGPVMGIDVHKTELAWCIVSEIAILAEGNGMNDKAGIQALLGIIKRKRVRSVAMESTAQYHFKLLYALLDAGIHVLVANPRQTKTTQGKKTDKLDANRIAIAHRDGRLKPSVISPLEIMALRKAMRGLTRKIEEQTKIKQRLSQIFHQKDVALSGLFKSKWGREVLRRLFEDDVKELLVRHVPSTSKNKIVKLERDLASFKSSMGEIERLVFRNEMDQLEFLEFQADRLRLVYYHLCRQNDGFTRIMKLMLSIPGIGPDTAAKMIAEIVDISYFPTAKKLVKWAGLAPKVYQSGHRKNKTGRLHKGGNKYLRRAIVLAASSIYTKGDEGNPLYRFLKRKKEEKEAYWLAVCATARKMLVAIWHMWHKSEAWRPTDMSASLLTEVQRIISSKLALLEKQVHKYEMVSEKISRESNEAMQHVQPSGTPPRQLLLALLESV